MYSYELFDFSDASHYSLETGYLRYMVAYCATMYYESWSWDVNEEKVVC